MTEEQVHAESHNSVGNQEKLAGDQKSPVGSQKKKKASWARTILWMVSMMLLVNVIFAILAYFLYRFKIIQ